MLKAITIINWIVIGVLAFLVIAETLHPTKGGDAAGRGIGQALYYLAIIALIVLLVLNLLPFAWSKYVGIALILLPFIVIKLNSAYTNMKKWANRIPDGYDRDGKPWFQDPQRQHIALAIFNGDVDQVKKMLREGGPALLDKDPGGDDLLNFTVNEATHSSYKPDEKTECLRLFFEAGARITGQDSLVTPLLFAPAASGRAPVIRLLIRHGADPNARDVYYKRPVLCEGIAAYQEVKETVKALLDGGADPNATWTEGDSTVYTPLLFAIERERWLVCPILIESGADIRYTSPDGRSIQALVREADASFNGDGYSTRADYEQTRQLVLGK